MDRGTVRYKQGMSTQSDDKTAESVPTYETHDILQVIAAPPGSAYLWFENVSDKAGRVVSEEISILALVHTREFICGLSPNMETAGSKRRGGVKQLLPLTHGGDGLGYTVLETCFGIGGPAVWYAGESEGIREARLEISSRLEAANWARQDEHDWIKVDRPVVKPRSQP